MKRQNPIPKKWFLLRYPSGPQGHQLFFLWIESTTVWWFKPSVGIIIHRLETINEFQYPQIKPAISPSWDPTISPLKKHQFDPICLLIPEAFNFFTNSRIVLKMCLVTSPRTFQCFHPARAVLEVKVMPLQPENFSDSKAEKMWQQRHIDPSRPHFQGMCLPTKGRAVWGASSAAYQDESLVLPFFFWACHGFVPWCRRNGPSISSTKLEISNSQSSWNIGHWHFPVFWFQKKEIFPHRFSLNPPSFFSWASRWGCHLVLHGTTLWHNYGKNM